MTACEPFPTPAPGLEQRPGDEQAKAIIQLFVEAADVHATCQAAINELNAWITYALTIWPTTDEPDDH